MYCDNCGATVRETASFCRSCGTRLSEANDRASGTALPQDASGGSQQEQKAAEGTSPQSAHDGSDLASSDPDLEAVRPPGEEGAGVGWLGSRPKAHLILAGIAVIAALGLAFFSLSGGSEPDADSGPNEEVATTPDTNQEFERCVTDLTYYAELLLTNQGNVGALQQLSNELRAEYGFESFEYDLIMGDYMTGAILASFESGVEAGMRRATIVVENGCADEYGPP